MAIHGVKAMTFDGFGTVVDWRSSIIADFQGFGRERGIMVELFEACEYTHDPRWNWR
jgi:FMN phosphatase YigB (HAD superfamily)